MKFNLLTSWFARLGARTGTLSLGGRPSEAAIQRDAVIERESIGRPVRDAQARAADLEGFASDVTEIKTTAAALPASELRFEATFENAGVGLAHCGMDGRWLRLNPAACTLLGYHARATKEIRERV